MSFSRMFAFLITIVVGNLLACSLRAECIPERQYFEVPEEFQEGTLFYSRIHPSGKYIMLTYNDNAEIFEIQGNRLVHIPSPLHDEAFPVPPFWNLIASPFHSVPQPGWEFDQATGHLVKTTAHSYIDHRSGQKITLPRMRINPRTGAIVGKSGRIINKSKYEANRGKVVEMGTNQLVAAEAMFYYSLDDIKRDGKKAQPIEVDTNFNDFYHSTGTRPESSKWRGQTMTVLSDGQFIERSYRFSQSGKLTHWKKTNSGRICPLGRKPLHPPQGEERRALEAESRLAKQEFEQLLGEFMKLQGGKQCELARNMANGVVIYNKSGQVIYEPPNYNRRRHTWRGKSVNYNSQIRWQENAVTFSWTYVEPIPGSVIYSDYDCGPMVAENFKDHKNRDKLLEYAQKVSLLGKSTTAAQKRYVDIEHSLGNPIEYNRSYRQPMASPDLSMFAYTENGHTIISDLKTEGQCSVIKEFDFATSKITFSPPKPGKKGRIVFGDQKGRAMVWDLDRERFINLMGPDDQFDTGISYPGFLHDGRVMFVVEDKNTDRNRVVVVDPNQLEDGVGECIQKDDLVEFDSAI